MRCSRQSQENGRFPLLSTRPAAACCCTFPYRPTRPARPAAGLLLDNLVGSSHLSVRFFLFFYFQSVLISLRSCKKTMRCHAVLCCAVPCRGARADTEKGQIDPDPTPPLWHKTDLYPSSSYAGTLLQLKTLQTSSSASRPSVVLLSLMPNSTA